MNYPIVCVLSGPESTRAKAELALEKASLTIIPPKEWPIARESYAAEHWPHLTALPSGQEPDEEHGFLAVLAETEAAFHAAYRVVEKAKWVLRVHYELPERPKPGPTLPEILHDQQQQIDAQDRRIADLIQKLGGLPPIAGAGFESGAGEFMQASAVGTYQAAQMRRSVFAWAERTSANTPGLISGGLLSSADMQLSPAMSGLVVYTSVGECLIPGTETTSQGGYHGFLSSESSSTLATANPSNPRVDAVVATSADPQYTTPTGGTSGYVTLQTLTGTPSPSASLTDLGGVPSLPGSSLLLGYVLVPAAATSLTSEDIGNRAPVVGPQFGINQISGIARGSATLTWSSSVNSGALVVAHGLGGTPTSVVATLSQYTASTTFGIFTTSYTSTDFTLSGVASSTQNGTLTASWIAML